MTKRLQAVGNSSGIIIDKPILELLRITPETEVDISTDGERLIVTPVRSDADRKGKLFCWGQASSSFRTPAVRSTRKAVAAVGRTS